MTEMQVASRSDASRSELARIEGTDGYETATAGQSRQTSFPTTSDRDVWFLEDKLVESREEEDLTTELQSFKTCTEDIVQRRLGER